MTDTLLKESIIKHLIVNFGHVQTERFIALVTKEPFDYTKWQENLYEDMSVEELSARAMANRINKKKLQKG
ncbi:MAG: hypothetical protein FWC20_09120 [Oscillospiraceae bacterium]|nr:hypothetical protein [Oscillospiraceae bacterium]MCL2279550.1 hypothetical protein [Oscillospiraceae bacterium]